MTTGRNDPCPCGSGRKYKKCHLAADTAASAATQSDQTSPFHEMDQRLVGELAKYAARRFPEEAMEMIEALDTHPEMSAQLGAPWLAYVGSIQGRPAADWYLEAKGWSLTSAEREWLEAQKKSWVSIWEIVRVDRGRGLDLRDVLTGEERSVHEVGGSKSTEPHLMLLGRVVDTSSVSVMCGAHSVPLRPLQAQRVVDRVRKKLRRKTAVSPDRLRDERIAWELLHAWSAEISAQQTPPGLVNTDGDPILLTEERWSFDPSERDAVIQRIAELANTEADESEGETSFTIVREGNRMHKDWENTIIASVKIGDSTVIASTNSVARADAIRER
ncbi:MAG TPA: SEC-C domain-containing protein, partial [Thermoanaerobaculia bacterium]